MRGRLTGKPDAASAMTRALAWIDAHLFEFDPLRKGVVFDARQAKKLLELSTAVACYVEWTGDRQSPPVVRITELLASVQRQAEFRDRLLRYPAEFLVHLDLYSVLRKLGHDDLEHRSLLERAQTARFPEHTERLPHRLMDLRLSLESGGFCSSLPSMESLAATSLVARAPSALYMDDTARYVLTHLVMYFYHYGLHAPSRSICNDLPRLRETLLYLIVDTSMERYWDLLAELLFSWDCCGFEDLNIVSQAWAVFLSLQDSSGAFPSSNRREPRLSVGDEHAERLTREEADQSYFWSHYHTTLVAIMACALHESRMSACHWSKSPADAQSSPSISPSDPRKREDDANEGGSSDALKGEVATALRSADSWLERQLPDVTPAVDRARQRTTDAALSVLVGQWICRSVLMDASDLSSTCERVIDLLSSAERNAEPFRTKHATLAIVATAVLAREGFQTPVLDSYVHAIARAMAATDSELDLWLSEKRLLLHRLELHPAPAVIDISEVRTTTQTFPLAASKHEIEALVLKINSCTRYGLSDSAALDTDPEVGQLLAGLAIHCLRKYDIDLGCSLLRAMAYWGRRELFAYGECIDFLLSQQRPDGSFGFYGPEESKIVDEVPGFDAPTDLYMPTTLVSLLTLAEATSDWRLFREVPPLLS